MFEELSVMKGVLVKGDKIVVPKELQATVIELSHETHGLGEMKTLQFLRVHVVSPDGEDDQRLREQLQRMCGCCSRKSTSSN